MSTAMNSNRYRSSIWRRAISLALAGMIAVGTLGSGISSAFADGESGQPTVTPSSSFSISVDTLEELTGLTAVVTGAGDGVNLRASAAHDADVVATLKDGTEVDLRIDTVDTVLDSDGITRWWPVTADGKDGWISGFYLANPDSDITGADVPVTQVVTNAATVEATATSFDYTGDVVAGIKVQVNGGGEKVNLRAKADAKGDILAEVPDGAIATLRIDTLDTVTDSNGTRWWPVTVDGKDGWINGAYLREVGADATATAPAGASTFATGSYVRIKTESGTGAVVRADPRPDGAILTSWNEDQVAQVMEGPVSFENSVNGWYKLTNGAVTGFVDGDLLVAAPQATTGTATATAEADSAFAAGDTAKVKTEREEGVNVRESGDPTSARVGYVPEAAIVTIVDGPVAFTNSANGWYEIEYNGVKGFVDGDLLVKTAETPTPASDDEGADGAYRKGDYVNVDTKSGVGVNVRQSPDGTSEVVGFLAENAAVQVIDGPMKDGNGRTWYKVTNGGDTRGWVAGNLFVDANGVPPVESASTTPVTTTTPVATSTSTAVTPTPVVTSTPDGDDSANGSGVSAQGFIYPLDNYTITQGFGCSSLGFYAIDPVLGCGFHDGLDLATSAGTDIHAAKAGTVVAAGWCDCGLGYYVEIDHGDGVHTVYGHMQSQPYVAVGQQVAQGETIGPVGSTGLSTGPHTHFMVTIDGVAQNPVDYLPS